MDPLLKENMLSSSDLLPCFVSSGAVSLFSVNIACFAMEQSPDSESPSPCIDDRCIDDTGFGGHPEAFHAYDSAVASVATS